MSPTNSATLYWSTTQAKAFPNFMLASEKPIKHPTTHMEGALLRNMNTLTYAFFCGAMYSIPQDFADEHAEAFRDELKNRKK